MEKMEAVVTDVEEPLAKAFAQSYSLTRQLVEGIQTAVHEGSGGSTKEYREGRGLTSGDAIHISVGSAVAAIQNIAIVTKKGTGQEITTDQFLYAALVVSCAASFEPDHMNIENGPPVLLRAMNLFEQIKGYKPDDALDQVLVATCRKPGNIITATSGVNTKHMH